MSFANERILPTGTYAIINAERNYSITFNEHDECLSSSSATDCLWTITLLNNKKWTIHGPSDVFMGIGPYAEEGDDVLSVKKPLKPHQWAIKQHPKVAQCYMIYSPSQPHLFCSLPNANEGTIPEFSADLGGGSSLWKFRKVSASTGDGKDEPTEDLAARQLIFSAIGNSFSVTIPAGWLTTVTSISCGSCVNLVRIRRTVDGLLEEQDFVSGWDAIDKPMTVDGSESDSLALPFTEESYVLLVEVFHSQNPARKDPRKLPVYKDLSANLRIITTSRSHAVKYCPNLQTFTIFDEAPDTFGSGRIQNAIITIHTQSGGNVPVEENRLGVPVRKSVRANVASSSGPRLLYYRIYTDRAIATKRPAYKDDPYIGRIMSKWVGPPYTAGSLKCYLSAMENINSDNTLLLSDPSSKSALADNTSISLDNSQTLGLVPEMPLILVTKVLPNPRSKPGTESFRFPPDAQSPLTPRFLYYGIYQDGGVLASRKPIDMQEAWVSRIDLNLVPPLSACPLVRSIALNEGIVTFAQLFINKDTMVPLSDDQIVAEDGNWPGSTADDPIVFTSGLQIGMKFDGSKYMIQHYISNGRIVQTNSNLARAVGIPDLSLSWDGLSASKFTFKLQGGGGIAFSANMAWVGPDLKASASEYSYHFIPSETHKGFFFICSNPGSDSCQAFSCDNFIAIAWKKFDRNDANQMWCLVRVAT